MTEARFEVDVTFQVRAADEDAAWQKVYDALVAADQADEGRREGVLPLWIMGQDIVRPI